MTDQPAGGSKPATPEVRQQQMRAYLNAPVPRIFANGIGINGTATDITVLFLDGEAPAGTVTLAYPVAKTLVNEMTKVLAHFERKTGEKIKDIAELTALLTKE
jgi:hypothetical protein